MEMDVNKIYNLKCMYFSFCDMNMSDDYYLLKIKAFVN